MASSNRAARLHTIASEMGVDPELVGVCGRGLRSDDKIRAAVQAYLDAQAGESTTETKKERKPGLTLSQRRALLRLLDEDSVVPQSAFRALPYEHLVEVGLAVKGEGDDAAYSLTDEGQERAESINPGYRVWAAGETVVLDDEGNPVVRDEDGNPVRPPAGTHRQTKAEREAERAAQEAAAKAVATTE